MDKLLNIDARYLEPAIACSYSELGLKYVDFIFFKKNMPDPDNAAA